MFNRLNSFKAIDHRSLKSTHFIHGRSLFAPMQPLLNSNVTLCTSYAMSIEAEIYSSKITTAPQSDMPNRVTQYTYHTKQEYYLA